ncbi:MAG: SpoIIE family protein phosphatase [Thermoflexales bacterium]|nr:SpoIIE family protein phosphatase [Thermoflexales bacterium]
MVLEPPVIVAVIVAITVTMMILIAACARLRSAAHRRLSTQLAELQALSDAVSAIASASLDEDELCRLVYERAAQVVDASNFQLGLFDGSRYVIKLRYSRGVEQPSSQFDLSEAGGIMGWLRDHARPLIVRDFRAEMERLPAQPRYISADPPRSAVFVPMVARDVVIGALAIQSERPNAYTDAHLRMLSIVANQAAAAIQNARALRLERTRARQMELVSAVARSTALVFDLQSLLPRLIQSIQSIFGYYFVGIFLLDELGQIVCSAASHPTLVGRRWRKGEGLVGTCIAEGRMIVVNDVACDGRFIFTPEMPATQSEAVLPLKIGERLIGALDLRSDRPYAFDQDEAHYLEVLSQQVAVAVEDARLYEQSVERQQLEQELNFAREIQISFLPRSRPQVAGWSVAGKWRVARQVGGDFYDFIPLPQSRWGIVIADVTDKGVPAALFMALSRTLVRAVASNGQAPDEVLARTNELILADSPSDLFVTMIYAVWNPGLGSVILANAGHNPPLLCRADGAVDVIPSRGIALGVVEQLSPQPICLELQIGDVLLLYTDGMTDALNAGGEAFGLSRLQAALSRLRHLDAESIADDLMRVVDEFIGDEPAFDDRTLVVLKREA